MIIDTAMAPFRALLGEPTEAERVEIYAAGARVMASYGWTGVHDMSVPYRDVAIWSALPMKAVCRCVSMFRPIRATMQMSPPTPRAVMPADASPRAR